MPLVLLLLAALIQAKGQPLDGGTVLGSATVPLERAEAGDTPVLNLTSPRGGVRLLLDTGASSTMVTPDLVRRLGLISRALPPDGFALAGGGEGCHGLRPGRTRLPGLELGRAGARERLRLHGIEALVLPPGGLPPGVDGVLGAPSLRRLPIWIDPRRGRLAFGAAALREGALAGQAMAGHSPPGASVPAVEPALTAEPAPPRPSGTTGPPPFSTASLPAEAPLRLSLRWRQGVPLLELRTPTGAVAALVDTGAEGLFVSPALASRLQARGPARPLKLVGFCGEQLVEQRPVSGIGLGPAPSSRTSVANPAQTSPTEVIVTPNPIFSVLGVEAIVGQELLRTRQQLWRLDQTPPVLELR